MFQTNQMSADYLFQQDKPYDVSFDAGDKAMQCGRHNDIFKLWLMWRSKVCIFQYEIDISEITCIASKLCSRNAIYIRHKMNLCHANIFPFSFIYIKLFSIHISITWHNVNFSRFQKIHQKKFGFLFQRKVKIQSTYPCTF